MITKINGQNRLIVLERMVIDFSLPKFQKEKNSEGNSLNVVQNAVFCGDSDGEISVNNPSVTVGDEAIKGNDLSLDIKKNI